MAHCYEPEKIHASPSLRSVVHFELEDNVSSSVLAGKEDSRWQRMVRHVHRIGCIESSSIEPVPWEDRQRDDGNSALQMLLLWFSMSLAPNNIIAGSLGVLVFRLSGTDAALLAVFGNLLGVLAVGYMSIWGPRSGSRTLIITRQSMGYYPNILCCALNVLTNIGYGMLNCTLGGQIVSKVSGGSVSVLFGIIIVALVSLVMAICGMRIFQIYERFSWLPQLIVLCVMIGTVGPQFDFSTPSQLPHEQVVANRVTFFFLSLSTSLAWVPVAADYYVYYPPQTKPWKTFAMTSMGLGLAMILTLLVGVGLGTAVASNPRAHDSPGSLIMAGYGTLGSFGKFCAVINAFGVIANNAPGAYSMSMNCQMLGDGWQKVPRPVFTVVSTIIYAACAIGGRNSLYEIFKNFLPLIGYWIVIWFVIFLEEHWFIRRTRGYDWSAWNDRRRLPLGLAAGIAFLAGWAGAIIGMDQIYYTGPVARAVAGGCDLGLCLAAGFTALVFPPIRMMELWTFRR